MDPRDHLRTNLVAGSLTSTHLTIRTMMPVLLAVLGTAYGFGEARLGELGASYSAGATVAAMTSPAWMSGLRMRAPALALLAIGFASIAAMPVVHSFAALLPLFALAGVGFGGVFALMIALLARTDDPNRSYGWQWSLGSVPGIVLVYAAPALASSGNPLRGTFGIVLVANLLMGLPALMLATRLRSQPAVDATPSPTRQSVRIGRPVLVGLFGVFATYAGVTGAWAFFGRVALATGIGTQFSGIVLAIATAGSAAVSLLAGEIGDRGARPVPMVAAGLGIVATLLLIQLVPGRVAYAVGVIVSIALAGYVLPFAVGVVSRLDAAGRAAGLPAAALGIGAVAGPAIAGHVYQSAGALTMFSVAGMMTLAGLAAYAGVHRRAFAARSRR